MSRSYSASAALAGFILTVVATTSAVSAQARPLTVDRIWNSEEFRSDLVPVQWMSSGTDYTALVANGSVTDLYRVDAVTGARQLLVAGADLVPPGASAPIRIESYQFSPDRSRLLIFTNSVRVWRQNTKGTYFVWDFPSRRLLPVSTQPGYQLFAKFSPDGDLVGFVRDHDLFVSQYGTGREWRITRDGSDDVINGTSDWVYEEELELRDAFRISPDGEHIAFWRLDQSAIHPFYLLDQMELYPELMPVRYPKAGVANASVRIGIAEIETGETVWVNLGDDPDIYVARMGFAGSSDEIWLTRLNRHQNRLDVVLADIATGASRVVTTDTDPAWVENTEPLWIENGRRFLLESERDGFNQLYLYERDGTLVGKVTTEPWDVTSVHGVDDDGTVYFTGTGGRPLERRVYRVGLDGSGLRELTPEPGTHVASFNADFHLFVDQYSRAAVPPRQTLRDRDGGEVRVVATNQTLRERIEGLGLRAPEFMTVPDAQGGELNAYVIKPPHFEDAEEYPLVMYVYGGPGSQMVRDSWGGDRYLWHQLLAQRGYLVASVDNRGTGGRGRDFKKVTYQHLGQLESADQIAAARYFGSLPYVDDGRIGIWGWSYGGYMSSLSLFRSGGVFRAAMAVAPVTDWRLYDTIYTERYMRTPQENPEGYRLGSPVTYADSLEGSFLIVHGTGDDNVHWQQTAQLIDVLEGANKQFDMRLYPNLTHSISGGIMRANLYGYMTEWLYRNLYRPSSVADQIP